MVLYSSLNTGIFLRRSHFFIIMKKKINKSLCGPHTPTHFFRKYPPGMTDEDNNFGGSLALDFRK